MTLQLHNLRLMGLLQGVRDEDAEEAAGVWGATLWTACVPIDALEECFQRAVEHHRGTGALVPSEVVKVWREINEVNTRNGKAAPAGKCDECGGSGFRSEKRIVNGYEQSGLLPCAKCAIGQAKRRSLGA